MAVSAAIRAIPCVKNCLARYCLKPVLSYASVELLRPSMLEEFLYFCVRILSRDSTLSPLVCFNIYITLRN